MSWKITIVSLISKCLSLFQNALWHTPNTAHQPEHTIRTVTYEVAASCCGDALIQQGQGSWSELMGGWMKPNTGLSLRKTCYSLQKAWNWDGSSLSNRMMTPIIQTYIQSYNGMVQIEAYWCVKIEQSTPKPQSSCGTTWKLLLTDGLHPIWLNWSNFSKKTGHTFQSLRVKSF